MRKEAYDETEKRTRERFESEETRGVLSEIQKCIESREDCL